MLYLAVAHFGRGRGQWERSECPPFWKSMVESILKEQNFNYKQIRANAADADQLRAEYTKLLDKVLRESFKQLYNITI